MEEDHRRVTVYDLTGLRVHPDGSRVHQTQQNLRFGIHRRQNTRDFRGWIAEDAGGAIIAPKYRASRKAQSSPEVETISVQARDTSGTGDSVDEGGSSPTPGKPNHKSNIRRALKRKEFAEDDSYISLLARTSEISDNAPKMPSPDLLKNIHHLAASYYDENGHLINASKRYKEARKQRKLHQLESSIEPNTSQVSDDEMGSNDMQHAVTETNFGTWSNKLNRDMYRVLDGSVLVAIGVLTEEMVKRLLSKRKQVSQQCTGATAESAEKESNDEESVDGEENRADG
ncbi:hypothetical protein NP233_g1605 [Leucocoprinus birnbaumii]|uniref:Uncharacterized protein n=1 Tax=Leucocoprinus birnbaumii TaxID=56174 RepID=A0AAD5YUP6_9AGAR|nr:hypothetical protein NP233_g1605 [Leucocoprinus birnbaumii]